MGPVEWLEPRTLLATVAWPRILNADELDNSEGDGGATPRIVNGEPTTAFRSVGIVGDRFEGFCTGTLINSRFVLTAGHCVDDLTETQARFTVAGDVYTTDRLFVHPSFRLSRLGSDRANDIAIMELSRDVIGVTPSPIFRDTPEVGQVLTLVGFGAGGTGDTGQNGDFGVKRAGTTPIDQVTATLIRWHFDDNSESNTGPGDSGGPAFLHIDDIYYVAGITSGGDRADAAIGDDSFDTRVDVYAVWIESIAGPLPPPTADPNPDPDPDPNPDPGDPTPDDHADEPGPGATPLDIHANGQFSATGFLERAGDRDVFQIELTATSRVTIELTGVGRTLDTYLRVFDSTTALIAENDDFAAEVSSRLALSLGPGVYFISAASFRDGQEGLYDLRGAVDNDDHGNTRDDATAIGAVGAAVAAAGTIGYVGDKDYFRFTAARSGAATITLAALDDLDTVLTVFDGRGRRIGFNDDAENGTDSSVRIRLRRGRTYFVEAAGYRAETGAYQLTIARAGKARSLDASVVRLGAEPAATPAPARLVAPAEASDVDAVCGLQDNGDSVHCAASHAAAIDLILATDVRAV